MKFSTRHDVDMPAADLFAMLSDFDRLERILISRGAELHRIDPAEEPGIGIGWNAAFDWRGQRRELRMRVTQFERPEKLSVAGVSSAFDLSVDMTVLALSLAKSRLIFELDVRPRNMRARLILQTAKLGKGQLDRKFERRIGTFIDELAIEAGRA